jgi:hypothetical protein
LKERQVFFVVLNCLQVLKVSGDHNSDMSAANPGKSHSPNQDHTFLCETQSAPSRQTRFQVRKRQAEQSSKPKHISGIFGCPRGCRCTETVPACFLFVVEQFRLQTKNNHGERIRPQKRQWHMPLVPQGTRWRGHTKTPGTQTAHGGNGPKWKSRKDGA